MGSHFRIVGGLWALLGVGLTTFTGWIVYLLWREPRGFDFVIFIPYTLLPLGVASLTFGIGLLTGRHISRPGATVLALLLIFPSVPLLLARMLIVARYFPTPLLLIHGIYTLWIIHSKAGQEWLQLHHVAKPRYPLVIAFATVMILITWTAAFNTRATQLTQ